MTCWNINILETQGSRDVAAPNISTNPMSHPLKIRKVNIGMEENPKFASVGDYWDEDTMEHIMDLLHEFQYLFPKKFSKMKGILEARRKTSKVETVLSESTIQRVS